MSTSRVFIHIGLPKTASTFFQKTLFEKHPDIHHVNNVDESIHRDIYTMITEKRESNFDLSDAIKLRDQYFQGADGRPIVLSYENLAVQGAHMRGAMVKRMKAIYPDAHIILCLRSQKTLMESFYADFQSKGYPISFNAFCHLTLVYGVYGLVTENLLNHERTVMDYETVFGKENMTLYLYEDLVRDQNGFVKRMCRLMGVDEKLGVETVQTKKENTRKTQSYNFYCQYVKTRQAMMNQLRQTLGWKAKTEEEKQKSFFYRTLRDVDAGLKKLSFKGKAIKPVLPHEFEMMIKEMVSEGNRRLAERYNLPLAENGYYE